MRVEIEHPDNSSVRRSCPLSSYTIEDYIKDFELDYLGFDGVPPEPVSDLCPGKKSENELEPGTNDFNEKQS